MTDTEVQPDKCERCGQRHGPEAAYSCSQCQAIVCGKQLYMGPRHGFLPDNPVQSPEGLAIYHQAFVLLPKMTEKFKDFKDSESKMIPYDCGPIEIGDGTGFSSIKEKLFEEMEAEKKKFKKQIKEVMGAKMTPAQMGTLRAAQHAARRPRRA